jgi:uncharacterized protein (DUF302 family)
MKPDGTLPDGLVASVSTLPPKETMDRLAAAVGRRGMTVLARIDHAGAARAAGLDLRATEVLVFGNPKGGTPLMQAAQTAGIDLPLKALVWQDAEGRTWVGYNDPGWIAARHGIADAPDTIADARGTRRRRRRSDQGRAPKIGPVYAPLRARWAMNPRLWADLGARSIHHRPVQ